MSDAAPQVLSSTTGNAAFTAPRRFARPRPTGERCDLCATPVATKHAHLIDPTNRQIVCACDACAILFNGAHDTKYRHVPKEVELLTSLRMSDDQWAGLGIPISLAFIFRSSVTGNVTSLYPSPVGPTEALFPAEAWQALLLQNPELAELKPDVEALLINRVHGAREYFRAPIDECFKLSGLIRTHWRGISGGSEVWVQIESFFVELKSRAAGGGVDA